MRGTHAGSFAGRLESGIIPAYAGNTMMLKFIPSNFRDHPRVCGEHKRHDIPDTPCVGSSPRMRGTLGVPLIVVAGGRIIPAYAGNTPTRTPSGTASRDHPRVCGEHVYVSNPDILDPGSSPRMRGTRLRARRFAARFGIIPAYAGNTNCRSACVAPNRDHPRVCGEHSEWQRMFHTCPGSSPRMRGTPNPAILLGSSRGIIPAYAGNTKPYKCRSVMMWDHPRVCGEHEFAVMALVAVLGSSPRMRGTQNISARQCLRRGIIPAYAGNTFSDLRFELGEEDHPRVCGEHISIERLYCPSRGSSPRMRGTLRRRRCRAGYHGIIPAYAGNTHVRHWRCRRQGDHPRVCGEHGHLTCHMDVMRGSSPRMRGTHRPGFCLCARIGIIPAYAGNTR